MLQLKSYSGPSERKEVFSVNAKGNATLLGKLTLAPGESGNQAATYGQLATLAEQIEQINPTYERGKYNFSQTEVTGSAETRGKYNLVRKNNSNDSAADRQACEDAFNLCNRIPDNDPIDCQRDYNRCLDNIPANGTVDTYIDNFSEVKQIKFSKYDADGAKHEWTDVAVGQLIDIFNDDNDDYFVGTITAIDNGTSVITLDVDKVQAKGEATGKARIKVFTLNNEIDELANYVRKTGDKMTGKLDIRPPKNSAGLWIYPPQGDAGAGQEASTQLLRVANSTNSYVFYVEESGAIAGKQGMSPTEPRHLTPKDYVDKAVSTALSAPTRYSWKRENKSTNPTTGHFCVKDSKFIYFHRNTNNGHALAYDSGFSTSAKYFPGQAIFSGQYAMNGLIHIWKSTTSGSTSSWTLMQMASCYKYRLGYGGLVEIEFREARGNWDHLSYETEYWISVDGFFN